MRDPEHGTVGEVRLLCWIIRVDPGGGVFGWVPGVEVRVKVHDRYIPVYAVESAESRESDAVVAAEGEEFRDAAVGDGGLGVVGRGFAVGEVGEGFGHLAQGEGVVEGGDGDVAAVDYGGPVLVGVDLGARVVAAEAGLAGGGGADSAGTEARAGAVGDSGVEGGAEDGDVVAGGGVLEAADVGEVGEGGYAAEAPLESSVVVSLGVWVVRVKVGDVRRCPIWR